MLLIKQVKTEKYINLVCLQSKEFLSQLRLGSTAPAVSFNIYIYLFIYVFFSSSNLNVSKPTESYNLGVRSPFAVYQV